MQLIPATIGRDSPRECAELMLEAFPPIIWLTRARVRQRCKGLSVPQVRAMVVVQRRPHTCLHELALSIGASMPTASRIVAGLVRKGLVTRHAKRGDRRTLRLELTAKGRTSLRQAVSSARDGLAQALEAVEEADRGVIARAMRVLVMLFSRPDVLALARGRCPGPGRADGAARGRSATPARKKRSRLESAAAAAAAAAPAE